MKIPLAVLLPLPLLAGCRQDPAPLGGDGDTPPAAEPAKPEEPPKPESFVGMTLEAAVERAEKAGLPHRVVKKDGESFPVTRDYRPNRVNFEVEKGIITRVTNG